MGNDPAEAGAVHDTVTSASPAKPITAMGLLGGDVTGVGGVTGAAEDPDVLAEPSAYPVRIVVTVTVDDSFADNPVTVTTPLPSMDAEPGVADAAHVHDASKFVTEKVNPELDDTGDANTGTNAAPRDVPGVLAEPSEYPVRVASTVTVDDSFADIPVTVTTPLPSMDAEPNVADAAHVHDASKLVTETVKPELVDTGDANTGTKAAPRDVPGVSAEPSEYPVRVASTVTVDDSFADNPVTVTTPVPSMDAEPKVADAAHVHDASKFVTETVNPEFDDTADANTGTKAAPRDAADVLAEPPA